MRINEGEDVGFSRTSVCVDRHNDWESLGVIGGMRIFVNGHSVN